MALDLNSLGASILSAMKGVLTSSWQTVGTLAAGEASKLAQTLVSIEKMLSSGEISQPQATAFMAMQKNSSQSILLAIEGIGIIIAQQAINAGLAAVS